MPVGGVHGFGDLELLRRPSVSLSSNLTFRAISMTTGCKATAYGAIIAPNRFF